MDYQQLSKRLQKVASFVPKEAIVADIGSDHAYLPAYLITTNQVTRAIAGEVVDGPFKSAKKLVNELGLEDVIDVRLGNGLDVIELAGEVDAITICGMGGALIRDILDRGLHNDKLSGRETLVLQPNIGEPGLRKWLISHGYTIVEEAILEENNKIYEVIVARKLNEITELTEKEYLLGPILLKNSSEVFRNKWLHERKQLLAIAKQLDLSSVSQEDKLKEVQMKITWIDEVLK